MKVIIKLLLILMMSAKVSFAEELKTKLLNTASKKTSEFVSGLIPGEGYTEFGIDFRENHSPDFNILAVRELAPIESGNIFTQFSLFNTEANTGKGGDERYIVNLGLGTRKLFKDNTWMLGLNNFYDYDIENEHFRTSIGAEIKSAVTELSINRYMKLGDPYNEENVLDGWDYRISTQMPYVHSVKLVFNGYEWEGVTRQDIKGNQYGSEVLLTPNLNLEVFYDDKDKKGLKDEWFANLQLVYPPRKGPTLMDGIADTAWKENKDMSGELLDKVDRQNTIMVEFKGLSTISRTN